MLTDRWCPRSHQYWRHYKLLANHQPATTTLCRRSQICPKSHFSEVLASGLWTSLWALSKKCAKRNIFMCSPVKQRMAVEWFNIVLKSCPKFQVLIFHFSEIDDLLVSAEWALSLEQEMCAKRKYVNFQWKYVNFHVQCYNMYRINYYRSNVLVKNYGLILSDLNIWLDQSKNKNLALKKSFEVC